jgi:hypothetical protein
MSEGTTRISLEVATEVNERLNTYLPWGVKAQVIRALIDMLFEAQANASHHIADDILRGRCKIVQIDVQNLNNGKESPRD